MASGTTTTANDLNWTLRDVEVLSIAQRLQDHYRAEEDSDIPFEVIVAALADWLELHLDRMVEELPEILSSTSRAEATEFRRHVDKLLARLERSSAAEHLGAVPAQEASVFTGNRVYSFEKLAAMTAYVAERGRCLYKTKLNKLLFYSDFVHYHLHGASISGSRYVHLPYGPVPDRYEQTLKNLALTGTLQIAEGLGFQLISAGAADDPITDALGRTERETIDWVLEHFGAMTASAISEYSHEERAYRDTRAGEYIAYEYAKFLRKLPRPGEVGKLRLC